MLKNLILRFLQYSLFRVVFTFLKARFIVFWQFKFFRRITYVFLFFIGIAFVGHANAKYTYADFGPPSIINYTAVSQCQAILARVQQIAPAQNYTYDHVQSTNNIQCVLKNGAGTLVIYQSIYAAPPTCTPPQVLSATETCVAPPPPTCQSGLVVSSGSYDFGLNPEASTLPRNTCNSGCNADFFGTFPATRQMINGKWHYFATGEIVQNGFTCTVNANNTTPSTADPNQPPTCAAGQASGTVNGVFTCVNQADGKIANPNTETTKSSTTETSVTNPDGSVTKTTTQTKQDGTLIKTVETTFPNGTKTTEVSGHGATNPTAPAGERADGKTQAAKDVEDGVKKGMESYCESHPNNKNCQEGEDEDENESGTAAETDNLYEQDPDLPSIQTSISNFASSMQNVEFYQAATGFFQVDNPSGGSCSGLNYSVDWGGTTFSFDLESILCGGGAEQVYDILDIGLKLGASFLAFSIAFLF